MDRVSLSPIDWLGSEAQLFLNPVWSVDQVRFYQSQFDQLSQGEAWIGVATSGTSEEFPKIVLLTRESLLASAQAVVNHLGLAEQDVCLHTLPDFHVGGLGIWARSHLSKCKVVKPVEWEWSGQNFVGLVQDTQATGSRHT